MCLFDRDDRIQRYPMGVRAFFHSWLSFVAMSVRMIWVVSPGPSQQCKQVLYSRKFCTVDRRVQKSHGESFVPLPDNDEFCQSLLICLGVQQSSEFVEWRDKASKQVQLPVVDIKTRHGYLWPVVVMEQHGILFACLAEVDSPFSSTTLPSLVKLPSVSVAFAVLQGIISFLGVIPSTETERTNKFAALDNYLSISMPFGRAYDCELFTINSLLSVKDSHVTTDTKQKMPGWKPIVFKGQSSVTFKISESVRCVQWDQPGFPGQCDVYGNIVVKAELEGIETDVSVVVHNSQTDTPLHMESLLQHPCVKGVQVLTTNTGSQGARKIRFSPPLHSFVLCHYTGSPALIPPILGVYKARGEKQVELLLQLKLSDGVANNFTQCEARLPFFNSGFIKNVEKPKLTLGLLQRSNDKSTLVWNIGPKFPKSLEVSLTAVVIFDDTSPSVEKDVFCTGSNCYVQLHFSMPNTTLTGCAVDLKTLQVSPPYKIRCSAEKELKSGEYKIWNSYGDVPYSTADASKD